MTDKGIAQRMHLSDRQIRREVFVLMQIFSSRNRFQLGVAAARDGLLEQVEKIAGDDADGRSCARASACPWHKSPHHDRHSPPDRHHDVLMAAT